MANRGQHFILPPFSWRCANDLLEFIKIMTQSLPPGQNPVDPRGTFSMPPLPVPVEDVVIWSQLTSVKDVQLQPTPVTTLNRPLTPACGALSEVGESVRFKGEPFSVRVKIWDGCAVTVIVPEREFTQPFGLAV